MNFFRLMLSWLLFSLFFSACSRELSLNQMQTGYSLLSDELKNQVKEVEKSIVGVTANLDFELQTFHYELNSDKFIKDSESPTGYKLKKSLGRDGITFDKKEQALSGGGLIIDHPPNTINYTILTSSHLVSPKDTVDIYYTDKNGNKTDVVFQRRIIKKNQLLVRGDANWRNRAELISRDPIYDIALIRAETDRNLGQVYRNTPGYDLDPSWGDWVFLFGYPREVKQMTGAWVSKSPYKGTFAVDAVVRFGFSGGPVFTISLQTASLVFVGLVKSVPSSSFEYVAPDGLPVGQGIERSDLEKLVVKSETVVHYGSAYCVHPAQIKNYLLANKRRLEEMNILLAPYFYGEN